MFIKNDNYWIISKSSNTNYWSQGVSPDWTIIGTFIYHPVEPMGRGVEPHYHDADEIWMFASGRGEAWIDEDRFDVMPNTVVYTPMGSVHRFQMFTDFDNASVVTKLERQYREGHLYVENDGFPEPTVPGIVLSGVENTGPIVNRGKRCPFKEMRTIEFAAGDEIIKTRLLANEYWLVETGFACIEVDGFEAEIWSGDVAMLKAGAVRQIGFPNGARVALVRE